MPGRVFGSGADLSSAGSAAVFRFMTMLKRDGVGDEGLLEAMEAPVQLGKYETPVPRLKYSNCTWISDH